MGFDGCLVQAEAVAGVEIGSLKGMWPVLQLSGKGLCDVIGESGIGRRPSAWRMAQVELRASPSYLCCLLLSACILPFLESSKQQGQSLRAERFCRCGARRWW